ncbi:hypothetical protein, partial [Salmonella sp. NW644]|uniref:hypothetical protein n=1 Tax=Salmonella sp. NW644 TaxID=2948166 RepID=UPI003F441342
QPAAPASLSRLDSIFPRFQPLAQASNMQFFTTVVAALGLAGTSLAVPSLVAREVSAVVDDAVPAPAPTITLSQLLDGTATGIAVSNDTSVSTLANSWHMTTYFATSCQGNALGWTTGDGNWCVLNDGTDWHSLRVDNFGGCSTRYFSGRGCSGGVQVTNSACWGFSQAEPIRAFQVTCPGRK